MDFFFFFSIRRFTFLLSILCLILLPSLSSATPSATISTKPSAYEVLQGFDFPIGLLPQGVLDYDLEPSTGKFAAYLNGSCGFSLEGSYQLKYKSAIKGHISNGRLSNLEGVSVKLYFFWVDIVEVKRNGDYIQFSVGIAGADFPIDNFEECPQCGCGINCYGRPVKKLRTNPFARFSFLPEDQLLPCMCSDDYVYSNYGDGRCDFLAFKVPKTSILCTDAEKG